MSSAPRSRRHSSSGPRTSSANRSVMSTALHATGGSRAVRPTGRPTVTRDTVASDRYRAAACSPEPTRPTAPDKPAVIMAGQRRGHHLRRARRRGQPGVARVPLARAAARRPRGVLPREPPALLRAGLGRPLRRPLLHGDELAAHHRGDGLHRRGLRGAGVRHLGLQGRPGRRAGRPDRRRRGPVHDGRDHRRLRALGGGPRRPARPPRCPRTGSRVGTCSTRRARRAGPRACEVPLPDAPLGTPDVGVPAGHAPCSAARPTACTSRPRRCTTPRRCASAWRSTGWAPRSSSWSTSTPRRRSPLIERHRVTHSQWVPTMFIRMLKLPDEVRRRYDAVVAAGGRSTPPPRARWR